MQSKNIGQSHLSYCTAQLFYLYLRNNNFTLHCTLTPLLPRYSHLRQVATHNPIVAAITFRLIQLGVIYPAICKKIKQFAEKNNFLSELEQIFEVSRSAQISQKVAKLAYHLNQQQKVQKLLKGMSAEIQLIFQKNEAALKFTKTFQVGVKLYDFYRNQYKFFIGSQEQVISILRFGKNAVILYSPDQYLTFDPASLAVFQDKKTIVPMNWSTLPLQIPEPGLNQSQILQNSFNFHKKYSSNVKASRITSHNTDIPNQHSINQSTQFTKSRATSKRRQRREESAFAQCCQTQGDNLRQHLPQIQQIQQIVRYPIAEVVKRSVQRPAVLLSQRSQQRVGFSPNSPRSNFIKRQDCQRRVLRSLQRIGVSRY